MFNRKAVRKALDKKMLPYAIIEGNIYLLQRNADGDFAKAIVFVFTRKGDFVNMRYEPLAPVLGANEEG